MWSLDSREREKSECCYLDERSLRWGDHPRVHWFFCKNDAAVKGSPAFLDVCFPLSLPGVPNLSEPVGIYEIITQDGGHKYKMASIGGGSNDKMAISEATHNCNSTTLAFQAEVLFNRMPLKLYCQSDLQWPVRNPAGQKPYLPPPTF